MKIDKMLLLVAVIVALAAATCDNCEPSIYDNVQNIPVRKGLTYTAK